MIDNTIMTSEFEQGLAWCRDEMRVQAELIESFVSTIQPPIIYASESGHVGWVFTKPGPRHFCILKAIRAVSGMNAAITLAESGFTQEVAVIIRTVIECTSLINFIATDTEDEQANRLKTELVTKFFEDYRREDISDFKRAKVRQGEIHKALGDGINLNLEFMSIDEHLKSADVSKLLSNVYVRFSCYVHCRYPETMDLYGGDPAHFHLNGMSGTPKDRENLEVIREFIESVSNSLRYMVLKFG